MNLHRAIKRQAERTTARRLGRPTTPDLLKAIAGGEAIAKNTPLNALGPDFVRWVAEMIQAHGMPPVHRQSAVAHEAGHAVVAMSMGATITRLSVLQASGMRGLWGGWCAYELPEGGPGQQIHALKRPMEATHTLLNTLAGIAGEFAGGYGHPASSLDEQYAALGLCRGVADVKKLDMEELFHRLLDEAGRRIAENTPLFDAITTAMHDRDVLEADDIAGIVAKHGIEQLPLVPAW